MDLGVGLPLSGPHASPASISWLAQASEDSGFEAVWTHETLLYVPGDVRQTDGGTWRLNPHQATNFDPIETLAFVAAETKSIKLGISALIGPLHQPLVLARRLATLDQLSNGRVIPCIGQGWNPSEFAATNVPIGHRGARVEELLAAMRAAWQPDPISFAGTFYNIPFSYVSPKPVQSPMPLIMSVMAPKAIQRAGRCADGYNPIATSVVRLREKVELFRSAASAAGRRPAELKVIVRANVPVTDEPLPHGRPFLGGSPEQIAEELGDLRELHIDHVLFTNVAQPPVDEQARLLLRLKCAVDRVMEE